MYMIIIPSYEPDDRLLKILKEIDAALAAPVLLVNDGSGSAYDEIFAEAEKIIGRKGGFLLSHEMNRGKGRALKTAFADVLENHPEVEGVVTADSDGQHTVTCIRAVMDALSNGTDEMILGVRSFGGEDVPWKSRFGNELTEKVFAYVSGVHVSDTQTGLRGIPRRYLQELLEVKGDRFEYEMRMLLWAADHCKITEIPIETVYDSRENHQTHFSPVRDSIRIYKILGARFFKFMFSALSSSVLDLLLFSLFCHFLRDRLSVYVAVSTVGARIISATYNYLINYKLVFNSKKNMAGSAGRYVLLAAVQMLLSAMLVTGGCFLLPFLPEVLIKIIIDMTLFFISYRIQQKFVF